MKKEDKELLNYLSAILPHKVYVKVPEHISINPLRVYSIQQVYKSNFNLKRNTWVCCFWNGTFAKIDEVKPYLRSMSSITYEEKVEYLNICGNEMENPLASPRYSGIDYLNSIHVDYRVLIPKGLAIEVTENNNPYKD